MKRFLLLTLFFVPVALFYEGLKVVFGDTWVAVGVFTLTLIAGRIGLFFYRKSKGIHDEFLD